MNFRDFALLFAVCLVWGLNIVVTRWVVADAGVPPIFFAAVRFAGIALVLAPFLRPLPGDLKTLFIISMCIGAAHFALLFLGLASAEASAVAVVGQLGVPFSTLLSMAFLGETVGWRRGLGIMLAFAGSMLIAIDPDGMALSFGLVYVVISAFIGACGGILMKRMAPISAFRMQAWVGMFSFAPLFALSFALESGQAASYSAGGWMVWLATAFAVLGVSIFGHGGFYSLIKKYDVSLLSPLTLMTPIWGVVFGITLLGEPLTLRLIAGAAISLSGVFVIAVRRNKALPEAAFGRKIGGAS
ncbi:MAG: EamA family transporter [Alphaproteobacteria bacterium]|jgi:O-acetylserine/cysteine efflux transporter|nr:EamA family transporter [Alphaproteobacteria bacterium]